MALKQIFLLAFIASFGFEVDSFNNKLINEHQFKDLFDSIAKRNTNENEIYGEILKNEIEKEQNAFDTMKGELLTAQKRNAQKKKNFHKNVDMGENFVNKREAVTESTGSTLLTPNGTSSCNSSTPKSNESNEEDKYVQFFEHDPHWSYAWTLMGKSFRDRGETPLKKYCETAHFRAGFGMAIIMTAFMNARTLMFKNEKHSPMKIDVVTYDIKDYGYYGDTDVSKNRFYITEGLRSDCVYYLTPANANKTEYYLDQHVCGLVLQKL